MRRAHPEQYNEELQNEDHRVQRPWSAFENLQLARAEIAYSGYNINQHLVSLFPERTLDSIKGHRRSLEYKQLRDRIRNELEEAALGDPDGEAAIQSILTPNTVLDHNTSLDTDNGPELFEAGPPPDEPDDPGTLQSPRLHEKDTNIGPNAVLDAPPTPPPPPTPRPTATLEPDPVKVYIEYLVTLTALDEDSQTNIDILLSGENDYAKKRIAISHLWRCMGVHREPNVDNAAMASRGLAPSLRNRKEKYAFVQRLYKSDRSRLAEGLISGTLYDNASPTFTRDEAFAAYNEILGTQSPPDNSFISDYVEHNVVLYAPIMTDELKKVLNARQSNSRGPDGIRISDIRAIPLNKLALLFNLVLFSSIIPDEWRANRTILIPKPGCDGADVHVHTWRPLTISSAGLRQRTL